MGRFYSPQMLISFNVRDLEMTPYSVALIIFVPKGVCSQLQLVERQRIVCFLKFNNS